MTEPNDPQKPKDKSRLLAIFLLILFVGAIICCMGVLKCASSFDLI